MNNYKMLEKWAADEFRSVNAQMEYLLDKAIKENRRKELKKETTPPQRNQHPQNTSESFPDQKNEDNPDT